MVDETLTLWDNGAVTLPKAWREKYGTRHFIARENERGYLVIMPILDVEYWEKKDGSFGLHFPTGIEAGELLDLMKKAEKNIARKERAEQSKKRSRRPS